MNNVPEQLLDKKFCKQLTWGADVDEFKVVLNEIFDVSRWSLHYELVVRDVITDIFWRSYYSVGATENQFEEPWDYADPKWVEVEPLQVTRTIYKEKKN